MNSKSLRGSKSIISYKLRATQSPTDHPGDQEDVVEFNDTVHWQYPMV